MGPSPDRATEVEALIDRLVDEGGMPAYVRAFHPARDPDEWGDEVWAALRDRLWRDCHDGERFWWQPEIPLIRSLYDRQLTAAR